MYYAQDEKEQGLCFAAASMAAEALALSRLVCTEGEALMQAGTPELCRSAAKLLTAVTQAQRDLNGRLETALTACGRNPFGTGELRLVSRFREFWWDGVGALPWKCAVQKGAGFWMDGPESIRLFPGRTYGLTVSLTAFSVGPPATVFLRLAEPCQTSDIPLFTLGAKGPPVFRQSVRLCVKSQASLSLRVRGPLGIGVVKASLEGILPPLPLDGTANPLLDAAEPEALREAGRQSTKEEADCHPLQYGWNAACRSGGSGE